MIKTALWLSLSLKVLCTPPPPPPARKIRRRNAPEAGFSIAGVLVASSIGLIVLTGTMQTLVNISHRLSVQEDRLKAPLLHSYLIESFNQTDKCTKTLEGLKIIPDTDPKNAGEYWADYTADPNPQYVASLKDAAGNVEKDLGSASQAEFKRRYGIDKFYKLIFRGFKAKDGTVNFNEAGDIETGTARLEAFVMDKGMFRKPIIVQLKGVKLKKDGHGAGSHKITACHSVDIGADVSAEIADLKARIKALEDLGLELNGGDLMSTKNFKTKSGHNIFTQGGGDIYTRGANGNIFTDGNGSIWTSGTGIIRTSGGDIYTMGTGRINSGGDMFARGVGNIYTTNGHIKANGANGNIFTDGNGSIWTSGTGIIRTSGGDIYTMGTGRINSGGDMFARGVGNIYTTNGHIKANGANGNIFTDGNGSIWTSGTGIIRTSGGDIYTMGTGRINSGGDMFARGVGNIYTTNGHIKANGANGNIFTAGGYIKTTGSGAIFTEGSGHIYTHGGDVYTTGNGNIRTPRSSLDGLSGYHNTGSP